MPADTPDPTKLAAEARALLATIPTRTWDNGDRLMDQMAASIDEQARRIAELKAAITASAWPQRGTGRGMMAGTEVAVAHNGACIQTDTGWDCVMGCIENDLSVGRAREARIGAIEAELTRARSSAKEAQTRLAGALAELDAARIEHREALRIYDEALAFGAASYEEERARREMAEAHSREGWILLSEERKTSQAQLIERTKAVLRAKAWKRAAKSRSRAIAFYDQWCSTGDCKQKVDEERARREGIEAACAWLRSEADVDAAAMSFALQWERAAREQENARAELWKVATKRQCVRADKAEATVLEERAAREKAEAELAALESAFDRESLRLRMTVERAEKAEARLREALSREFDRANAAEQRAASACAVYRHELAVLANGVKFVEPERASRARKAMASTDAGAALLARLEKAEAACVAMRDVLCLLVREEDTNECFGMGTLSAIVRSAVRDSTDAGAALLADLADERRRTLDAWEVIDRAHKLLGHSGEELDTLADAVKRVHLELEALRRVVEALPKCQGTDCNRHATFIAHPPGFSEERLCDDHGAWQFADNVPYAPALRALESIRSGGGAPRLVTAMQTAPMAQRQLSPEERAAMSEAAADPRLESRVLKSLEDATNAMADSAGMKLRAGGGAPAASYDSLCEEPGCTRPATHRYPNGNDVGTLMRLCDDCGVPTDDPCREPLEGRGAGGGG